MDKRWRIAIIAGAVLATGTLGFATIPALAGETPDAPYNTVLHEPHQGTYAKAYTRNCSEVGAIGDTKDGWVFNAPSNEFDKVVGMWAKFDTGDGTVTTYIKNGDNDPYPHGFANASNPHLAWVVVPQGWKLITAQAKILKKKEKNDLKLVVTHTCAGSPAPSPKPSPSASPKPSHSPSPSVSPSPEPSNSPSPEPSTSPSPEPSDSPSPEPSDSPEPSTSPSPEPSDSPSPKPSDSPSPKPSSSPSASTPPSESPSTSPSAGTTPSDSPSPTPGSELPRTGAAITAIAVAGVALVATGAVLVLAARRRRELSA
jgi:LPXTG-motif cell wall-anchored protein